MGIENVADFTARTYFEQGLLEPLLQDWECLEGPPIYVLYRRGSQPSARVRAFVEFVIELFSDLETSPPASANETAYLVRAAMAPQQVGGSAGTTRTNAVRIRRPGHLTPRLRWRN